MSKLILWNLVTLDGYFEGAKSWDLDFHQSALNEELFQFSAEQLRSADGLIFGRVTYEGMAAYWQTATGEIAELMNGTPRTVFSKTLERADWAGTTLVKDLPAAYVRELKAHGSRNLFVFGSANLSTTLIDAGLFDEYRLLVVPVILGLGRPIFPEGLKRKKLALLESRPFSSGSVLLRYAPENPV